MFVLSLFDAGTLQMVSFPSTNPEMSNTERLILLALLAALKLYDMQTFI